MTTKMLILSANGNTYEVKASPMAALAEVLRGELGLTGTKIMITRRAEFHGFTRE